MAFDWNAHPVADESNKFNWDDHPTAELPTEEPSQLESAVRGAAQGASLGYADEATGLGEAAVTPSDWEDFVNKYKQHRDESRANYNKAEKAHPLTYGVGTLAGGVAASPLLAELGPVALGAGAGLGTSDADLTEGDVTGALKDTGKGAALGAAFQVIPALAKKAGSALSDTPIGQSFARGSKGQVVDKSFPLKVGQNVYDTSSEAADALGNQDKHQLGDLLYQSVGKDAQSSAKASNQILDAIDKLSETNPELAESLAQRMKGLKTDISLANAVEGESSSSPFFKELLNPLSQAKSKSVTLANTAGRAYSSPLLQNVSPSVQAAAQSYTASDIKDASKLGVAPLSKVAPSAKTTGDSSGAPETDYLHYKLAGETPEQMKQMADYLSSQGQKGVAKKVQQAAQDPDNSIAQAQADFVMQQTPAAKKQIMDQSSKEDISSAIESLRSKYRGE